MNKISLIVQGDGSLSHRQRLVLNPARFRTPQELKEVLSSELQHADGTPWVIPPSASLSFLEPASGTFVPLVNTATLVNNSRVRIDVRSSSAKQHLLTTTSSTASRGGSQLKAQSSASSYLGSSPPHHGGGAAALAVSDKEATADAFSELLVYHAQVVSLLATHLNTDRGLTPQDLIGAYEAEVSHGRGSSVRHLITQLHDSASEPNFQSATALLHHAKIITQFAFQSGASARESSEGVEAERMKQTVSAYQRRIERLERELSEVTNTLEQTRQVLLNVSQEKERLDEELRRTIEQLTRDNDLKKRETAFLKGHVQAIQRDLTNVVDEQLRAKLDEPPPTTVSGHSKGGEGAGEDGGRCLPTTREEEKYLALTSLRPATAAPALTMATGVGLRGLPRPTPAANGPVQGRIIAPRPTTAPATAFPTATQHPRSGAATLQIDTTNEGLTSRPSSAAWTPQNTLNNNNAPSAAPLTGGKTVLVNVRILPCGVLHPKQDMLHMPVATLLRTPTEALLDAFMSFVRQGCALHADSTLECSYVSMGERTVLLSAEDIVLFLQRALELNGLTKHAPSSVSLSVIELDDSEAALFKQQQQQRQHPVSVPPPPLQQPQQQYDETSEDYYSNDKSSTSPLYQPHQKARLEAAKFLGKQISLEESNPGLTSPATGSGEGGGVQSPRRQSKVFSKLVKKTQGLAMLSTSGVLSPHSSGNAINHHSSSAFAQQQQHLSALSTRNLFLNSATVTVPSEDDMRRIFASLVQGHKPSSSVGGDLTSPVGNGSSSLSQSVFDLQQGTASSTLISGAVVVQYLQTRYDDMGDPKRFVRLVTSAKPMAKGGAEAVALSRGNPTQALEWLKFSFEEFCMLLFHVVRE